MVSSGGGGGGGQRSMPNASPPPGNILGPVGSYQPKYTSFLPSDGSPATGLTPEMQAAIMAPPPPPPQAPQAMGGGFGSSTDAFAQRMLDYQKQQQMSAYMLALDPRRGGQFMQTMQNAPQATTPTERLLAQASSGRKQLAPAISNCYNEGGGGHLR